MGTPQRAFTSHRKILVMYWNAFINIYFILIWAIFFQLETKTPAYTPSNSKPITQDGIIEAYTNYTQSLAPKDTKLTGKKITDTVAWMFWMSVFIFIALVDLTCTWVMWSWETNEAYYITILMLNDANDTHLFSTNI